MNVYTGRLGIDIGSTTAKVVLLDAAGQVAFSAYRRHNAEILESLCAMLRAAIQELGDLQVEYRVTGSAGMGLAEKYDLPFIQEVVASAEVVRQHYPQVRTLVDIGGEDAKIIFFSPRSPPDMRMNGSCAGGTGAFIDEMALLLGVPVSDLQALASRPTTLYPIASRCGVFAKTDLQNLLSRQLCKEDIAASVLHAVVLQTLATLARGREVRAPLLFSGGPLTFIPALQAAFLQVLGFNPLDVVQAASPELLPALGAALASNAAQASTTLSGLLALLSQKVTHAATPGNRESALFESPDAYRRWAAAQTAHRVARVELADCVDEPYFLGIDCGSTTSKVVLVDRHGRVAFHHYASNAGHSIRAVQDGLRALQHTFAGAGFTPRIARSIVTGYGEDLIRAAFGLDGGMVETLAHYRAARAFDPQVSFILDIGGQDMKAIFVRDGHIQNIEINEACSSGCGTFIEAFARNMGYGVAEFARLACSASAPCNLGTRCTVFMNSRVKQALREGAEINDISAGLAFSVIKNALYKVLKITNTDVLGEHIVVQGGAFRNPAVHRALETLIERPVVCPDLAELMGAYGAALTARDQYNGAGQAASSFVGFDGLQALGDYQRRQIHCRGCENKCLVTKLLFPNGNRFYSGNRCERIYSNGGQAARKGFSLPARKLELLFDREVLPAQAGRLTIGIPRVLNMFENYPFWHALFTACGLRVQLSSPSSNSLYQRGAAHIMSENLCFPAKLVSGHILDLIQAGVDRIFYPMVVYEQDEFADACNTFNCPVVSGYPDVVRSAIDPAGRHGIPLDRPPISFRDDRLLAKACRQYLSGLGIQPAVITRALARARQAQADYKQQVVALGEAAVRAYRAGGRPLILLLGRPYHIDPQINHHVPEILTAFGVDVITEDCLPTAGAQLDNRHVVTQWEYLNRYLYAARWVGQQENVELVQLNSFGCGPDAYILEEVRLILAQYGKHPTVIRIDEIESPGSTRLRLRSMLEALKLAAGHKIQPRTPRTTTRPFEKEDTIRTVIVPDFSPFCSPPVVRPFMDMGYHIVCLPPSDRGSVETGLKYTNNEICYPGIITLGDLINALQSGEYDLQRTAVGFSQTGGQCRATSIPSMIKKALVAAGFEQVPVVTLATSLKNLNDQPGFDFDTKQYVYKAALAMMYADALSDMYHSTLVRERRPGATQAVADRYLQALMDGATPLTSKGLLSSLECAVQEFNAVETRPGEYPRVGIVGEVYVKYNAFSNNNVARWLMDQGLEVVLPGFFEFFDGGMVSILNAVQTNVKRRDGMYWISILGLKLARHFLRQFDAVRQGYRRYRPHHDIRQVALNAQQILCLNHQYGEGWLLAGEIATFAQDHIRNVLCLQPFGCIANHIIAKGVQKRLQETFPQLNLIFLDADAGLSEVNFFNRLHFFVDHAKQYSPGQL